MGYFDDLTVDPSALRAQPAKVKAAQVEDEPRQVTPAKVAPAKIEVRPRIKPVANVAPKSAPVETDPRYMPRPVIGDNGTSALVQGQRPAQYPGNMGDIVGRMGIAGQFGAQGGAAEGAVPSDPEANQFQGADTYGPMLQAMQQHAMDAQGVVDSSPELEQNAALMQELAGTGLGRTAGMEPASQIPREELLKLLQQGYVQ